MPIRTTNKSKLITTAMAAKILGFSPDYVRQLITEGKIKAEKMGHDYLLTEYAIRNIKRLRFPKVKEIQTDGSAQPE